eukprot:gnl/TRDRNA2_/TRDRNA2_132973_c0_seq1.p1 gnl/TRDRNA2_/TRDRNA2_132973_c0~~gnl/TRDRNA2_/TRDRNA2_132973_c0_seq1.p1  ORF type:complete len:425 (+),score=70.67 gnl/TRDRNA2_/TRDRNA2_132973_c0_seq1:73-1347(+)
MHNIAVIAMLNFITLLIQAAPIGWARATYSVPRSSSVMVSVHHLGDMTAEQARDSANQSSYNLGDSLFARVLKLPVPNTDLDKTTVGKPGDLATFSHLRPKPLLPRQAQRLSTNRVASPMARYCQQVHRRWTSYGIFRKASQEHSVRSMQDDMDWTDVAYVVENLQGIWEDDVGLKIVIIGKKVQFTDGTNAWPLEITAAGKLTLRGAEFVGTPDQPRWRFPNGMERYWSRPEPVTPEQESWKRAFLEYKELQVQLLRQLWAAASAEDFKEAARLRTAYTEGGTSIPAEASLAQQARLFAGRRLVPGVCFKHSKYGYRGVIIGCEPWCNAPVAWRANMGIANLPRGEQQPFYHCLADMRDRPGQTTFVAEENLVPSAEAFPIEHPFVGELLIQCDEIQGYLPGPMLDEALKQQRVTGEFSLGPD